MGLLIDGKWHDKWYDTGATGGRFVRKDSAFRNWVTPDGAPAPSRYPLMWGIIALTFVVRGGGRFSVDRLIGYEI
jgi:glutathionyl-hydroquinone reductase